MLTNKGFWATVFFMNLYKIDCSFSSLGSSLCFDFSFDVLAKSESEARWEARRLLKQAKIDEENHITIVSIEKEGFVASENF